MTNQEIIEKLKAGSTITKTMTHNYKRGKLQRGTTTGYKLDDIIIKVNQFEAIKHMLIQEHRTEIFFSTFYKHNPEYNDSKES